MGPSSTFGTCSNWSLARNGSPHLDWVSQIKALTLGAYLGGFGISIRFATPLRPAPEGVYFGWEVYLFQSRSDASPPSSPIVLQIEDRGTGWVPTGWTLLEWS
jgi:hypothetical protein